jgi:peptidoglycan/LPS O-acetylase OafA/YrhL
VTRLNHVAALDRLRGLAVALVVVHHVVVRRRRAARGWCAIVGEASCTIVARPLLSAAGRARLRARLA